MSAQTTYKANFKPNIVLFARHFPPHVSGGARRPYYLTRALRALGCRVYVIAPALSEDMEGLVIPHVRPDPVIGAPGRSGIKDMLRDWLFWPDPDIRWTRRAVDAALAKLPFKPDWVITTSPPESIHYAGVRLKQAFGCYWYADARDHWLVRPFRKQRNHWLRNRIERLIAVHMLGKADLVSAVNEAIACEMHNYVAEKNKVFVLPHFSIEDHSQKQVFEPDKLNLVYTGSFSLSDPDCRIEDTLEVFETAAEANQALHLHIAGRLSMNEEAQVRASSCASQITLHGVVALQTSFAMQRAAHALILAASAYPQTPPGKAAEYESTGKPIIAITEAQWASHYNGSQTALENLLQLGIKSQRVSVDVAFTQLDAAKKVLHKMAETKPTHKL